MSFRVASLTLFLGACAAPLEADTASTAATKSTVRTASQEPKSGPVAHDTEPDDGCFVGASSSSPEPSASQEDCQQHCEFAGGGGAHNDPFFDEDTDGDGNGTCQCVAAGCSTNGNCGGVCVPSGVGEVDCVEGTSVEVTDGSAECP